MAHPRVLAWYGKRSEADGMDEDEFATFSHDSYSM